MCSQKVMTLEYRGRDSWSRPVYECNGNLYVDVDPVSYHSPSLCTKLNNAFDGEPDCPSPDDVEVVFMPQRDMWR